MYLCWIATIQILQEVLYGILSSSASVPLSYKCYILLRHSESRPINYCVALLPTCKSITCLLKFSLASDNNLFTCYILSFCGQVACPAVCIIGNLEELIVVECQRLLVGRHNCMVKTIPSNISRNCLVADYRYTSIVFQGTIIVKVAIKVVLAVHIYQLIELACCFDCRCIASILFVFHRQLMAQLRNINSNNCVILIVVLIQCNGKNRSHARGRIVTRPAIIICIATINSINSILIILVHCYLNARNCASLIIPCCSLTYRFIGIFSAIIDFISHKSTTIDKLRIFIIKERPVRNIDLDIPNKIRMNQIIKYKLLIVPAVKSFPLIIDSQVLKLIVFIFDSSNFNALVNTGAVIGHCLPIISAQHTCLPKNRVHILAGTVCRCKFANRFASCSINVITFNRLRLTIFSLYLPICHPILSSNGLLLNRFI